MRRHTFAVFVVVLGCLLPKQSLCANYGGNIQPQNAYGSTQYQSSQWSNKANSNYDTHLLENHYNQIYQQQLYKGSPQNGFTGYGKNYNQQGIGQNWGYSGNSYSGTYSKPYSGYGKQTPFQNPQDVAVVVPPTYQGNSGWINSGYGTGSGYGFGYDIPQYGYGFQGYPLTPPISPYLFQGPSLMDKATDFIKTDTGKILGSGN